MAARIQGRRAAPVIIPAPFGGMNTRDGLEALKPHEARSLVNFDPAGNAVKSRRGQADYSTGGPAASVETLVAFNGTSGSNLVGIADGDVYDYSGSTATLLSAAGYTDSRFQTECYNNRLIGVNGTDTPWSYDGSSVGATGFSGSGLTIENLVNIKKVRNRLWFCENNSADVWYGGVGAITSTLTKFQLSQVVGGGYCVAIGAHSQDAGDGPDDYTAFVMSTGEVVIYSGDPSTTFTKVGNFMMPPPVGRQCLVNIGGQLAVVTRMGLVPLAAALNGIAFDILALGNFGKVSPSIQDDVQTYGDQEGWSVLMHDGRVIINVPLLEGATSKQWVYNALTGAWTTYTNWNASTIVEWGGGLYLGLWGSGIVRKATGSDDAGEAIAMTARCAFVSPAKGNITQATAIRFDMSVDGSLSGRFGLDTEGVPRPITVPPVTIAASAASTPWGSPWGSPWSTSDQYQGQWFSTYGRGRLIGLALEASGTTFGLEWYSSEILMQPGGPL